MAWIAVCDDGPGIAEAEQGRLLAPFEAGTGETAGSGLGLAIASDVAKAHGGVISFAREQEMFCVRLSMRSGASAI